MPAVEVSEEKYDSREAPPAQLPALLNNAARLAIRVGVKPRCWRRSEMGKCGFQATSQRKPSGSAK